MSKNLPFTVELEPGTYSWCSCGKSHKEPFCDGSHEGTSFVPIEFTVVEKKNGSLPVPAHKKSALLRRGPLTD